MEVDYYKVLGVSRDASEKEIDKSYRALARKYHPDLSENKEAAKERFQQIQQAYDTLSDPEKRKLYDQFGSSYERMAAGGGGGQPFGGFGGGGAEFDFGQFFGGGGAQAGSFDDLLRQFAGTGSQTAGRSQPGGGRSRRQSQQPGATIEHEITIPFQTSVLGGKAGLNLQRGGKTESITITIPPGIESGKKIRLRGQGEASPYGGPTGDLLVRINVAEHPYFTRRGNNLIVHLPVNFREAWLGAKIELPTPGGSVKLSVPSGTSSGRKLRLKGQGVQPADGEPGDLIVEIDVQLPAANEIAADSDAEEFVHKLAERFPMTSIRDDLRW